MDSEPPPFQRFNVSTFQRFNASPSPLCVKELASALDVSKNYVYEMRRYGFPMHGVKRQGQTATVTDAVHWISENEFRLVDGRGITST